MHEHKFFPKGDAERNQAILFAIKILDALEVRNALECSVEAIGPTVIRALQAVRGAARLGPGRGCGVVADGGGSPGLALLPADPEAKCSAPLRRGIPGPRP